MLSSSQTPNKHLLCNATSTPPVPSTPDHYCIDPMQRLDWEEVQQLIATKKFFVLHAPRQTGKTSTLLAMMDVLNHSGEYTVLYMQESFPSVSSM